MHALAAFSLKNRALIALVTAVAVFFGVVAAGELKRELIPSVSFPQLAVVSTYSGASPAVVSTQVSKPLEQALRGISGLQNTSSTSTTGSSVVTAEFDYGTDLAGAEQKMGSAINRIRASLPTGVDPQVIAGSIDDFPIITIAITGDRSRDQLAKSAEESIVPELEKLDGVRAADLSGEPGERITITTKAKTLTDHGLQDTVIDDTLKASGVLVPAGSITENGTTRSVQVGTELGSLADIEDLPLTGVTAAEWNGSDVPTIGDVATVQRTRDPVTTVSLVNGREALTISVTKLPSANTVDVSQAVRGALPGLKSVLGAGGSFTVVSDQAPYIEESINSLLTEGGLGLVFAVVVILLFLLSVRATLITAISIPTSVLITLIGMQSVGYTLNILTLGAITIAIGRVVDDSIVVTENIARHLRDDGVDARDGEQRRRILLRAVREVAGAVTASTLTTVTVFLPIALVGGTVGELFRPFALTVTLALAASLFVALTIVPVLAYWFMRGRAAKPAAHAAGGGARVEGGAGERQAVPLLQRGYRPILSWTLRFRWIVIPAALVVFVLTALTLPLLQTNYLGSSGQNVLTITETLPDGTSLATQTVRGRAVDAELRRIDGVQTVATSIGTSGSALRDAFVAGSGTQITYQVTTDTTADQTALQNTVRTRLKALPDVSEITLSSSSGFGASSDISVDITAGTASALQKAADQVLRAVQKLPEVAQASSNLTAAQSYLAVRIDAQKAAKAGYSEVALAQIVARATQPTDVGSITIGDSDLTIYLTQQSPPTTLNALKALKVPTVTNAAVTGTGTGTGTTGTTGTTTRASSVRLDSLATVTTAEEPAAITTSNVQRSASITATPADQNTGAASLAVTRAVAKLKLPAGASATLGGVTSDQSSAFGQLGLALLAAILIVYVIMVATFRSLFQPLLLLISVPFAATGAVLLQLASGIPLGVASLIGLLMLIGIVVTNAIVLIDLVNQYRERGASVHDAVLDGASRRLRPILMTALATILALVPMAAGLTGHGGFISQPLAIVVIGGLLSSTVLTLLVLPTLYYLCYGRRERRAAKRQAGSAHAELGEAGAW